ncbi:hypothetical protein [Vibrio cionasavignyae]|uniref:hypothetical protein n=1 Tax=Vibrio cionasavignyae TaxID=2910252 RepID=UPI003D152DFE
MNLKSKFAALSLATIVLTGCATPGETDPNEMTKQGAIGGALLGLAIGAITGDADVAAKAALVGGVAGGVSGASEDLANNRENIRAEKRDAALAAIGNQNSESTPKVWKELDNFTGKWRVTVQTHVVEPGSTTTSASGSLKKTSEAEVVLSGTDELAINANFSFTPETGYKMQINNEKSNTSVEFAGEFQASKNRYSFYPENLDAVIYEGVNASDVHMELGFVGKNIWIIDTFVVVKGEELKVQTFKFNRQS